MLGTVSQTCFGSAFSLFGLYDSLYTDKLIDLPDNSLKRLPSVGHGSLTCEAKALWKSLWMRASAKCFKCKSK